MQSGSKSNDIFSACIISKPRLNQEKATTELASGLLLFLGSPVKGTTPFRPWYSIPSPYVLDRAEAARDWSPYQSSLAFYLIRGTYLPSHRNPVSLLIRAPRPNSVSCPQNRNDPSLRTLSSCSLTKTLQQLQEPPKMPSSTERSKATYSARISRADVSFVNNLYRFNKLRARVLYLPVLRRLNLSLRPLRPLKESLLTLGNTSTYCRISTSMMLNSKPVRHLCRKKC